MPPFTSSDRRSRKLDWITLTTLMLALLGWLVAGLRTYGADTAGLSNRVTVIETKQIETDKRMERIDNKLDRILERLK